MVAVAALWTGWGTFGGQMWGLFPPHYGYSAYIETAAMFLAPWWPARVFCGGAVLLCVSRCAWMGVLAGWAYLGGQHRRALAAVLAVGAMVVAVPFKTVGLDVRTTIWKAALITLWDKPGGYGPGGWWVAVAGKITPWAHSDALQVLVCQGVLWGTAILAGVLLAAGATLRGHKTREKATLVCLLAQSITDNRLHRPICILTLAVVWTLAARSNRRPT